MVTIKTTVIMKAQAQEIHSNNFTNPNKPKLTIWSKIKHKHNSKTDLNQRIRIRQPKIKRNLIIKYQVLLRENNSRHEIIYWSIYRRTIRTTWEGIERDKLKANGKRITGSFQGYIESVDK